MTSGSGDTPYPPGTVLSYESPHGRVFFTVRSFDVSAGVYIGVTLSASGQIEAAGYHMQDVTLVQLPPETEQ